jgi:hypothetical protein
MIVPLQFIRDGAVRAGVITLPQASITVGAVGVTALAGQLTMDAPFAGSVKSGVAIV